MTDSRFQTDANAFMDLRRAPAAAHTEALYISAYEGQLAKQPGAGNDSKPDVTVEDKPRITTYRPHVISESEVTAAHNRLNANSDMSGLTAAQRESVSDVQNSLLDGRLGHFEAALQRIQDSPDRAMIISRVVENLRRSDAAIKMNVSKKDGSLMVIDNKTGMAIQFHRTGVYEGRYSTAPNGVGGYEFRGPYDDRGLSQERFFRNISDAAVRHIDGLKPGATRPMYQ